MISLVHTQVGRLFMMPSSWDGFRRLGMMFFQILANAAVRI